MDLVLRAELAVKGLRAAPPVRRRAGAGPSDDGHWRLPGEGCTATLPMAEESPFELAADGSVIRNGVVVEDAMVEPVDRPRFYDLLTEDGVPYEKLARLHAGDVRELMESLPDGSVDRAFILFPDPWPKVRHHKRRLVQPGFISDLARVMRPGARLRFATDWRDYASWTLERLFNHNDFDWTAERADDWRKPPADHVTTRYEDKRLGDTAPLFLEFTRR